MKIRRFTGERDAEPSRRGRVNTFLSRVIIIKMRINVRSSQLSPSVILLRGHHEVPNLPYLKQTNKPNISFNI